VQRVAASSQRQAGWLHFRTKILSSDSLAGLARSYVFSSGSFRRKTHVFNVEIPVHLNWAQVVDGIRFQAGLILDDRSKLAIFALISTINADDKRR
jgi:hypothetical protein